MDIILRQAKVIDPSSPFHQQVADLVIRDGKITGIASSLDQTEGRVIEVPGLHVSPGWADPFSHFCDPGFEFKETLETGSAAAAAGGYTDVLVVANTAPVIHNKSGVEYIVQKSRDLPARVHPIGAITKNAEGKELAEMYDMHQSGAVAFSDGLNCMQSSGVFLKALQYVKAIGKTVIQLPDDKSIAAHGLMHEGIMSTRLGLAGKPDIAEELMVVRDIELVKYTDSSLHITGISTAKSVQLIRAAKKEGLKVSCSVTPYHLFFCDEDLHAYDSNLKVNPPLRRPEDRAALREGVLDGTIDCIASHHLPHEKDSKVVEFEYAKYGMTGLETAFALVRHSMPELEPEQLVQLFSLHPRQIFGLPVPSVTLGSEAVLTLFQPDAPFTLEHSKSKSRNTPLWQKELTGKPLGIINKRTLFLNS